jgi:monoterpene epsilon-lactone hydrolase
MSARQPGSASLSSPGVNFELIERKWGPSVRARGANLLLRLLARPHTRLRSESDIKAFRDLAARLDARLGRVPSWARIRWNDDGPVRGQWIETDESRPDRFLLYFHGGGFVARTPQLHAALVARICRAARVCAFVPDYRLAPEHVFPAAPEDCLASYDWLVSQVQSPKHLVLGGDSAGGCLALATLIQARDRGLRLPACTVLLSPATNLAEPGESYETNAKRDPLASDWESIQVLARSYLSGADARDPRASPAYGDFEGLPPLLTLVGADELLLADAVSLSDQAKAAGVDASLEVWRGVPHVFPAFDFLPEGRLAIAKLARFIDKHIGGPTATGRVHQTTGEVR